MENRVCNCRVGEMCPLDKMCLTPNIVYEPKIISNTNDRQKKYLGASEIPFKEWFDNHLGDFNTENI